MLMVIAMLQDISRVLLTLTPVVEHLTLLPLVKKIFL